MFPQAAPPRPAPCSSALFPITEQYRRFPRGPRPFVRFVFGRFPLEVEAGQGGVFSVDWTEGSSRYQADRVFSALDGTVLRLEVTEIGTDDAELFLPMEKF